MHIWFDISAGVAGDMLLGALLDAGADLKIVQQAIDAVIPDSVAVAVEPTRRAGLRASQAQVQLLATDVPHRDWRLIRQLLTDAALDPVTKERSLAVFTTLARAEARAHGMDLEDVHFHEVGALDSIADVVGVCAALTELGVSSLSASPVAVGAGRVITEHGDMPVPVPAVAELLVGWTVVPGVESDGELATPTGLAIIRALASGVEPLALPNVAARGIGAGTKDFAHRANVVRCFLGGSPPSPAMIEVAANVDDLDPRLWPSVLAALLDAGAVDAWLGPILMKKGRPAHTVGVLVAEANRVDVVNVLFQHTTTFGVRWHRVEREVLTRNFETIEVFGHQVSVKVGVSSGGHFTRMPEYDDLARVAAETGRPAVAVLNEAWGKIAGRDPQSFCGQRPTQSSGNTE